MKITIPVSVGELLDKITILTLKSQYSNEVTKELQELKNIAKSYDVYSEEDLIHLQSINQKLWNVEDELRECERKKEFDERFIHLARQVYILNDERAKVKREINERKNSEYSEVKVFKT